MAKLQLPVVQAYGVELTGVSQGLAVHVFEDIDSVVQQAARDDIPVRQKRPVPAGPYWAL